MAWKSLYAAILLASSATWPAGAAELTLTRTSRPVTLDEIAAGAPLGGIVHDFFVTAGSDLLSVGDVAIDIPLYRSSLGGDADRHATSVSPYSFMTMPGETVVLGGGFDAPGAGNLWGDLSNDGPQHEFHFSRLTVNQTGSFTGRLAVRGYQDPVYLPFNFSLPGSVGDLHLMDNESSYALNYSLDPPPFVPPTPDPIYLPPAPGPTSSPTVPNVPPTSPIDPATMGLLTLSRRSRAVTSAEAAGGAPAGGMVHELFLTSSSDILSVGDVALSAPRFKHELANDFSVPPADLQAQYSALSAHSFITTPGASTFELGGGFEAAGANAWGDLSDDGPQDDFMFARITVAEEAIFSGRIAVAGGDGPVELPFSFGLPGSLADPSLSAAESAYTLSYRLTPTPPPLPPVVIDPVDPPPTSVEIPPIIKQPEPPITVPPIVEQPPAEPPAFDPPIKSPLEPIHIKPGFEIRPVLIGDWVWLEHPLFGPGADIDVALIDEPTFSIYARTRYLALAVESLMIDVAATDGDNGVSTPHLLADALAQLDIPPTDAAADAGEASLVAVYATAVGGLSTLRGFAVPLSAYEASAVPEPAGQWLILAGPLLSACMIRGRLPGLRRSVQHF